MLYTEKNPALFIIGVIMLALWYTADSGMMAGYIEHLASAGKYSYLPELKSIPLYFGIVAAAIGLWQWLGSHKEGHLDFYTSTIAGGMFILLIAMLVRWFIAPEVAVVSVAMGKVGETGKHLHTILGLNYVVMGIVAGIVIVNVFKVPAWAQNGVRLSRLGLKTGVILLGTLYSAAELKNMGSSLEDSVVNDSMVCIA